MKKENRITPDAMQMALGELAAQLSGLKEEMAALKEEAAELKGHKTPHVTTLEKPLTKQDVESIVMAMFEHPIGLKDLIKATGVDIIERLQTGLGDMFNTRLNNHADCIKKLAGKVKDLEENNVLLGKNMQKTENDIASLKQTLKAQTKHKTPTTNPLWIRLLDFCFGGKNGWLKMFLTFLGVAFVILIALLIL